MEIRDFSNLYDEYVEEDIELSKKYTDRINRHFFAYLKNPTEEQTEVFRSIRDSLIIAYLAEMFKKWDKQLKKVGNVGYKLAKQQTKKLPFVNKKLTTQKILNLYKSKANSGIADLSYVMESIKANSERAIKDIETNITQSKKTIQTEMLEEFNQYGITYFYKKDGARMSIEKYIKTKSADLILSSFRNAFFAELLAKNVELVEVLRLPSSAIECSLCIPYDNKYLALEKKEGYETIAEAKANGLFHYFCQHYVVPVFEENLEKGKIKHSEENIKHKQYNERKGNVFNLID